MGFFKNIGEGAAAIGTSLLNTGGGIIGTLLQNRANRKLAEEEWKRNIRYNDPSAQMARLKKAGLNPNLVYGSGNATNLQKYTAPTQNVADIVTEAGSLPMNSLTTYQDFRMKQAQTDNLKAQNKILLETARLKEAEADNSNRYYHNRSWKMEAEKDIAGYKENELFAKLKGISESNYYGKLFAYQLDALDTSIRAKEKSILKMQTDMDYKAKQLEYYLVNMLGPYASKAVQTLLGRKRTTPKPTQSLNTKKRIVPGWEYNRASRMTDKWPNPYD
jgi:hypothetical protein